MTSNQLKRVYPVSATIIHLSDHKLKRKPSSVLYQNSPYFIQRKNIKKIRKQSPFSRLQQVLHQETVVKYLLTFTTIGTLFAIFLFLRQTIAG